MKTKHRRKVLAAAVPGLVMAMSLAVSVQVFGDEPGWSQQEDGWHYVLEDGSRAFGWMEIDGKFYYLPAEGGMLADTITPNGYYVNPDGSWFERKESILEVEFTAPYQVRYPISEWIGKDSLAVMKTKLEQVFSGNRSFRVGGNAIEFVKIETAEDTKAGSALTSALGSKTTASNKANTTKETILLGLYREPGQGRYRMDIRVALDGERAGSSRTASCNYEVFRAMVYQVSSAPELVASALYSAWEEENLWGIGREQWTRIGDCEVKYGAGDGYGRFYIRPIQERN